MWGMMSELNVKRAERPQQRCSRASGQRSSPPVSQGHSVWFYYAVLFTGGRSCTAQAMDTHTYTPSDTFEAVKIAVPVCFLAAAPPHTHTHAQTMDGYNCGPRTCSQVAEKYTKVKPNRSRTSHLLAARVKNKTMCFPSFAVGNQRHVILPRMLVKHIQVSC